MKKYIKIFLLLLSAYLFICFLLINPFFGMYIANIYNEFECYNIRSIPNPAYDNILKNFNSNFGIKNFNIYRIKNIDNFKQCSKIENADYGSFKVINEFLAIDRNNAYISDFTYYPSLEEKSTINNIDFDTYKYLGEGYSKDKNHVYNYATIMKEYNPESFEILNSGYAKDKNGIYCINSPGNIVKKFKTQVDSKTFQLFIDIKESDKGYAKDKNNVYYYCNIVNDTDIVTFNVVPEKKCDSYNDEYKVICSTYDAEDKNNKYLNGKVVVENK